MYVDKPAETSSYPTDTMCISCVANNIITQPLISNSVLVVLTTEKKKPSQLHFFQVYLTKALESHTKRKMVEW